MDDFSWDAHARFFLRSLLKPGLPKQYTKADTQRMTLVYFCVTGLDLLSKLDSLSGSDNTAVKKWILSHQIRSVDVSGTGWRRCGFRGGPFDGDPFGFEKKHANGGIEKVRCLSTSKECSEAGIPGAKPESVVSEGNLAMTYSALASLAALGDGFSDVDVGAILRALRTLQHQDGSFQASVSDPTCDLRFLYCACAVSSVLKNWDGVDRGKAVAYIERCYDFDGGIGLAPGREACAGPTYCAVASMELMGVLDKLDPARRERLVEWCVKRQEDGFQSRPNKLADSCCSFWIGATLALLGRLPLVDRAQARRFHISCQNKVLGGFAKVPGSPPDLLHAFYSASWLSLAEEPGVEEMNVSLGITKRARALLLL